MRKFYFLAVTGLFLCNSAVNAQAVLPEFSVKNNNGKISVSWQNKYPKIVKGITVQRSFDSIKNLEEGYYTCNWCATYTFSKTGRQVVNRIKAHMKIENGLIIEHSDAWSLHKWSQQALGFSGWLLGWAGFYRRKLKNGAKRNLMNFIQATKI